MYAYNHSTLILANDDTFLSKFETIMRGLNIPFRSLKGNYNTFKKYSNEKVQVLTLNSIF